MYDSVFKPAKVMLLTKPENQKAGSTRYQLLMVVDKRLVFSAVCLPGNGFLF